MSLLSSTVKMPPSIEACSGGVKIKRKGRRRRAVPPDTISTEDPGAQDQTEFEAPRERAHRSRRPKRDEDENTIRDVRIRSKHRSNTVVFNVDGGSSRRILNGTGAASLVAPASKRRPEQSVVSQEATIAARRALTSSASSVRPSNRKRLDHSQHGSGLGLRQRIGSNNNDPEYHGNDRSIGPESFAIAGQDDWLTGTLAGNNRVTLPSRASKYRNLSAGVNKKPRPRAATTQEIPDRPPSRQRHAFPTNLIDNNAFDAPENTERSGGVSGSSSASSARSGRRVSSKDSSPSIDGVTTDRPPSRYMVKAKRNSKNVLAQDPNAPSLRGVVDKNIVFSCNQTHHDPKTDGFADVDESVPPPFRIEVTTDALDSPAPREKTSGNLLSARRWPFNNQEQLLRMAVRGCRSSDPAITADLDNTQSPLQWFGKDDQINNAHLFETVISMPSPRATLEPDVDVAIEDDLEDSDGPQQHSHEVVNKQLLLQNQQEPQHHVENHFPSRRAAAAASKMTPPTTTLSLTDNPELQWIQSSTNPFFVESSPNVDYDSMDPETAIEQTPLYSSEDLMTLAATEMTDLRLDDYTGLGDASIPAPPPSTSGGWGGSRLLPASRSPPLRTSLGKDFLSLFAQH